MSKKKHDEELEDVEEQDCETCDKVEGELLNAEQRIEELEEELEIKTEELSDLQAEYDRLEGDMSLKEDELLELQREVKDAISGLEDLA